MAELEFNYNVQINMLASKLGASEAENARLNAIIQSAGQRINALETELAKVKTTAVKVADARKAAKK